MSEMSDEKAGALSKRTPTGTHEYNGNCNRLCCAIGLFLTSHNLHPYKLPKRKRRPFAFLPWLPSKNDVRAGGDVNLS